MEGTQTQNQVDVSQYPYRRRDPRIEEIVNIFQWIIVALSLALIVRSHVAEAFRIPTGSMAETLRGDHYHLRCPRCGYKYDIGADYNVSPLAKCPNCEYVLPEGTQLKLYNGDRIFVYKCGYHFTDPDRWDVIVFKNPTNPYESYIKRLIAKPGETLEIIDGDIYINDHIARKPPSVQKELWMIVYDNNYCSYCPQADENNDDISEILKWPQPFENIDDSRWNLCSKGPTVFSLDSPKLNMLFYNTDVGKNFRTTYAYNDSRFDRVMPICGDLKISFILKAENNDSIIGAHLERFKKTFRARALLSEKKLIIEQKQQPDNWTILAEKNIVIDKALSRYIKFEMAFVDNLITARFDDSLLKYDLGTERPENIVTRQNRMPRLMILGSGKLSIRNIRIHRDIFYISDENKRAGPDNPFTLGTDEFFACGDNSPNSSDSRLWSVPGRGNNDRKFRQGIVPREYLVGQAFMVYWANAFSLEFLDRSLPIIPNASQIKFIVGGKPDKP